MSELDLFCYRVKVVTTNSSNDTFCLEREGKADEYGECEDCAVYVIATGITDVARQLEGANIDEVERMGPAFRVDEEDR